MADVQKYPTESGNPYHDTSNGQFASKDGHFLPSFTFDEFLYFTLKAEGISLKEYNDYLKNEMYGDSTLGKKLEEEYKELVEEEKKEYIANQSHKEDFEFYTYTENWDGFLEKGVEKLFTKETINKLYEIYKQNNSFKVRINNGYKKYKNSSSFDGNGLAIILQRQRFPKLKMTAISEEDFKRRVGALDRKDIFRYDDESHDRVFDGKLEEIPLYRSISTNDENDVHKNFFEEPKSIDDTFLGGLYNNYGSATYMTTQKGYAKSWDGNIIVGGIVKPKEMKILDFTNINIRNKYYDFVNKIQLPKFKYELRNKIFSIIKDDSISQNMSNEIIKELSSNRGFFCIALGYDALFGNSGQLDILNSSKVELIYE